MSLPFPEAVVNSRGDLYAHVSGFEGRNPEIVEAALATHAKGYCQDMRFVTPAAIDLYGHIAPDIDHARGPNVEYFIATDPNNPDENRATMRIIHLDEGQTVEELPAFQVTKEALSPEGEALIRSVEAIHLKEIAALAKTNHDAATGLFEIVRKAIHRSIGSGDTWFFSIVANTHDSLGKRMAARSFTVLGEDVPIIDDRVDAEQVRLRPVTLRPDDFFDHMADAIQNPTSEEDNPKAISNLVKGFMFFTNGIEADKISPEATALREKLAQRVGATLLRQ